MSTYYLPITYLVIYLESYAPETEIPRFLILSIQRIAYDRISYACQMHPDLMPYPFIDPYQKGADIFFLIRLQ